MPFAAALSTLSDTEQAVQQLCRQALAELTVPPHLALVFFSPHHAAHMDRLVSGLQAHLANVPLIGCNGESIAGHDQEIEQAPAVSLWLAHWSSEPALEPFHLELAATPEGHSILGWPDGLATADPARAVLLLLADPFTFPIDLCLKQLNTDYPGLRVLGGMASGGRAAGDSQLLLGPRLLRAGAVGVLLPRAVVRSIVSQGCRPIGQHMVITRAQENIIVELGGRTPLAQLQRLWPELTPHERQLFQQGLHVGRVINEYRGEFQRGDFLVRNVLGLDQDSGALAITDRVRVGQTVQFHVRDADTADEDLHALLQMDLSAHVHRPGGALLFTCNGRGTRLFSEPNHDAHVIRAEAGPIPLAGFFAQGELGPIGGQNFIHGFTASVGLFED